MMKTKHIIIALIICCGLAILASQIASSYPDGLEWVAEKFGFIGVGEGKDAIKSPMPDYEIPFIKGKILSLALAGIAGTLIMFIVIFFTGKIIKYFKRKIPSPSPLPRGEGVRENNRNN